MCMIKKTIYFSTPVYLSLRNGQMLVRLPEVSNNDSLPDAMKESSVVTRPVEDIGVVVLDNRQITITSGLLDALLANNCAVVTCDARSMPVGLLLPVAGNSVQSERFRAQIDASLPLRKQLWQQTVRSKIRNQMAVLDRHTDAQTGCMQRWIDDVRSGDADNLEARAAAYYWKNLFQDLPGFRRERGGTSPNGMLNYGYAILRAVIARALVACGLLPTLGIYHHNRYNAYCLADDIMEPYRPFVDAVVLALVRTYGYVETLDREVKSRLLAIPSMDVSLDGKRSPLMIAAGLTASSLNKCFAGEQRRISYPDYVWEE